MSSDQEQQPTQQPGRVAMSDFMDDHRLEGADAAIDTWRSNADARTAWQTYHLIGDAMRSSDLAFPSDRDQAFFDAFRKKLGQEAVVLAPSASRAPRLRFMAPVAAMAGFMAVAGVVVLLRGAELPAQDVALGAATSVDASLSARPVRGQNQDLAEANQVNGQLIRDARLDQYLQAHRRVWATSSTQVPGTMARNVDTVVFEGR